MEFNRLMVRLIMAAAILMCLGLAPQSRAFAAGECQGDVARFCQGAQGPKQELACLKAHKKQLSPECKVHVAKMLKSAKEAK